MQVTALAEGEPLYRLVELDIALAAGESRTILGSLVSCADIGCM